MIHMTDRIGLLKLMDAVFNLSHVLEVSLTSSSIWMWILVLDASDEEADRTNTNKKKTSYTAKYNRKKVSLFVLNIYLVIPHRSVYI